MICSLDEDTHANIHYGGRSRTSCKFRFTQSTTIWNSPLQYVIPLTTWINTSLYIMWKFVVHLLSMPQKCRIYGEKKTRTSSINGTKIVLAYKDNTWLLTHTLYAHTIVQIMFYLKRILRWITTAATHEYFTRVNVTVEQVLTFTFKRDLS